MMLYDLKAPIPKIIVASLEPFYRKALPEPDSDYEGPFLN